MSADELPGAAVLPGLDVGELPPARPGQTSDLLERALKAAEARLTDDDLAMIGAARAGAFALDQALAGRGPKVTYAVASILSAYAEVLGRLGFSPDVARGDAPADGAAAFLATLGPTPPSP